MLPSGGAPTWQGLAQVAACALLLLPRFLLTAAMLWLLDFLCIRRRLLVTEPPVGGKQEGGEEGEEEEEEEEGEEDPPLCVTDGNRLCTLASLRAVWHGQKLDFFKAARLGGEAPNPEVVPLDGRRRRLLDYARGGRPLVLNFGSCTWPPFMARLRPFRRLAARNADLADFVLVYIEEAHPTDGWLSHDAPFAVPRHRCLQDRLRAASLLLQRLPQQQPPRFALAVDTMDNASSAAYGAYFQRLYVVQQQRVMFQGGRGPDGYRIAELHRWLDQYRGRLLQGAPSTVVVQA